MECSVVQCSPAPLQASHSCHCFSNCHKSLFCSFLARCRTPCACYKLVRTCGVFSILTWKRASRHNSAHLFDIQFPKSGPLFLTWKCASRHSGVQKCSERAVLLTCWLPNMLRAMAAFHFLRRSTCKSGPMLRCFARFGFETRFAPQPRALFRHLNFQKCSSQPEVRLAF